jgi:predicted enzyme related to lactoylglutathione lyase
MHFEIHAGEPERAMAFYGALFGWTFQRWGDEAYWLVSTGDGEPGIDGGLVARRGPAPSTGQAVNAFVCTVGVPDLDARVAKATSLGGAIALPKTAVPTIGWLAYVHDTEGNLLGMMQADANAR